ncbi:hypothetical protein BDV12DRAFT_192801 [Aspergillus spectabilis]
MVLHSRLRPLPHRRSHSLTSQFHPPSLSSAEYSAAARPEFGSDDQLSDSDSDAEPEDLFASFLQIPHLFPDDVPPFHGDPGQYLLYSSPRYGELQIMVPSYPSQGADSSKKKTGSGSLDDETNEVDEGRKLCAHFLWSAGMVVAEGIEHADTDSCEGDSEMWKVKGEKVLELGAGAALPSLTAALASASSVTITDHPSSPALLPHGSISFNTTHNLRSNLPCPITIHPHEWGTLSTDPWALSTKGTYTRIIAADCYWLRGEHENLARTMKWFLAPEGKVWVVAGFHTGREVVRGFFETVTKVGLVVERIWERDLNTSLGVDEVRRDWVEVREGEGVENRRRWCVVAVLGHAGSSS